MAENPYVSAAAMEAKPAIRPYCFLSLPYRAHANGKQAAYDESLRVVAAFKKASIPVYNPLHFHAVCQIEPGLNPDDDSWFAMNEPFLRLASAMCIVRLDGYHRSEGIKAEQRIAAEAGVPVWMCDLGDVPTGLIYHFERIEADSPAYTSLHRKPPSHIRDRTPVGIGIGAQSGLVRLSVGTHAASMSKDLSPIEAISIATRLLREAQFLLPRSP